MSNDAKGKMDTTGIFRIDSLTAYTAVFGTVTGFSLKKEEKFNISDHLITNLSSDTQYSNFNNSKIRIITQKLELLYYGSVGI